MEPKRMPKSIDEPPMVLLWSMDEFVIVAVLFGLGLVFKQLLAAIVGIVIFSKVYRRFRDGQQAGFMYHYLYWIGLTGRETFSVRNPFIRRFLP